jgi:hypothetical protein
MRVFKIWALARSTAVIDRAEVPITCLGGSNRSEEEAVADGQRRLAAVRQRIAGELSADASYEADIREEPLQWLGEHDVVTRNRYGAEVLNTTSCVFIDIDEPVLGFWARLFSPRLRTVAQRKENLRRFLAVRTAQPDLEGCSLRIYETPRGFRIILGRRLDPRAAECQALLRSFKTDRLYALLCRRQNCFRARLTPKPHRIGLPSARLKYPYAPEEVAKIAAWVAEYDRQREGHAACRLVQVLGRDKPSPMIEYHDLRTGARSDLPLA